MEGGPPLPRRSALWLALLPIVLGACRSAPIRGGGGPVAAGKEGTATGNEASIESSPPPAAEPAERPKNTLRWKTNELSHFGYDIFRAESESGPFVKINDQPVAGLMKNRSKVQNFEYQDDTIDPSKDYWYYVEAIPLMGERSKFTPTLKAPAKIPAPVTPPVE